MFEQTQPKKRKIIFIENPPRTRMSGPIGRVQPIRPTSITGKVHLTRPVSQLNPIRPTNLTGQTIPMTKPALNSIGVTQPPTYVSGSLLATELTCEKWQLNQNEPKLLCYPKTAENTKVLKNKSRRDTNRKKLFDKNLPRFALIDDSKYADLAGLATPEKWSFGHGVDGNKYPNLKNLLFNNYKRLVREKKIVISENGRFAAFNTGLSSSAYEDIYALFVRDYKQNATHSWRFMCFCFEGGKRGGTILAKEFKKLPEKANFFRGKNINKAVYEPKSSRISVKWEHIIKDHLERFPLLFLKENTSSLSTFLCGMDLETAYYCPDSEKKDDYFSKLGNAVIQTPKVLRLIKMKLDDAVEIARKKANQDYTLAVPMYYAKFNAVQLLLPLALCEDEKADLALVVDKYRHRYHGITVLTLEEAYLDSRLLRKSCVGWLEGVLEN